MPGPASRQPPDDDTLSAALAETRAVYAELASRPVDRGCTGRAECCHFRLTGRTPQLTRGEALVLAAGWKASGRKSLPDRADGACPLLDPQNRCLVYAARPFGCRTHFCAAAGGPLARPTVIDLIRRLEKVDESLRGDGPKPLGQALREALAVDTSRRGRSGKNRAPRR